MNSKLVFCLLMSLVVVAISGCKKPITEPNSGIYRGTFFEIFQNTDTGAQGIAYLALHDEQMSYELSGDSLAGAPYDAYGTYSINSSTTMNFVNSGSLLPGQSNMYTLDTTFQYTFDNLKFKLWVTRDTAKYEYSLIRI
ncbi:MAG: hypothetical protein IPH66_04570 [Crocinitomicaceae bacterium]|nr:hypothetical protein [Crocinitomicaceae bacterium]